MDPKVKLGFDNYSIRALGWKAPRLLDLAASLQVDVIFLSDLNVYEERTDAYLHRLKRQADSLGLEIQVGMLSACPGSVLFDPRAGTAQEQLRLTIRIANALGSRVARCVLGNVRDRRSPGGIEARIAEMVEVLRDVRQDALAAGVKIAVENHAGDMQSWELIALIEEAGPEFVGATLDSGNAVWALEHPSESLELLGPYALTTGIRDSVVWSVPDGATLQWTAMGEGSVDWPAYFDRFAELCPNTPVVLETISGRPISLPYWADEFWDAYRSARVYEFVKFLRLTRDTQPRPWPTGEDGRRLHEDGGFQMAELERSVRYCREVLGLGAKAPAPKSPAPG
jgi:sugar phosphate isomerase/epimerase